MSVGASFVERGLPGLPVDVWAVLGGLGESSGRWGEEDVEGFSEFASDMSILFDDDTAEERLVEAAPAAVGGLHIGLLSVGGKVEGGDELLADVGVVEVGGLKPLLDVGELVADTFLLAAEQVKRDRVGIVRLQELRAFVHKPVLLFEESLTLLVGFVLEGGELFEDDRFELIAFVVGERVMGVVIDDLSLNLLDENGLEGAVGALLVASDADEVGVAAARSALGVGDEQSAAAVAAPD